MNINEKNSAFYSDIVMLRKAIKEPKEYNFDVLLGLCSYLGTPRKEMVDFCLQYNYMHEVRIFLKECFVSWKHYSGTPLYPVPSTRKYGKPEWDYHYSGNLYIGEYGKLRMDLLDHIEKCYLELCNV